MRYIFADSPKVQRYLPADSPVERRLQDNKDFVRIVHHAWTMISHDSLLHKTDEQFENELGALMHQEGGSCR